MANRIETRVTYTAMAIEATLGVPAANPLYRALDLNTYSDASTTQDKVKREVMSSGRRVLKGAVTGESTRFGYNIDNTLDNTLAQVSSFLFNRPLERGTSRSVLATSASEGKPITARTATTITVAGANAYLAKDELLVLLDGTNDRTVLKAGVVTATEVPFTTYGAGPAVSSAYALTPSARIVKVGELFPAGTTIQGFTDRAEIVLATPLKAQLQVGEWIFIGGGGVTTIAQFAPMYARVVRATPTLIVLDTTTRPVGTVTAIAINNLPLFYGSYIVDGDITVSSSHMRYLGEDTEAKSMVETFKGCVASELSINATERALLNMDMSYMCIGSNVTAGVMPTELVGKLSAYEQDPINTSTDVVRQRMYIPKVGQMNTAAIHSFVQELNMQVANNLTEDTAMEYVGAVGITAGKFNVTGSMTVFFNSLAAINAAKCNCTVGVDTIYARKNSGLVIDLPAVTIATEGLTLEVGQAIKMPLTKDAHKSQMGHMMSYTVFHYLPNEAMPTTTACDC